MARQERTATEEALPRGWLREPRTAVGAPSHEAVRSVGEAARDAMVNGTPGQRKALLKELVVESNDLMRI